MKRHLLLYILVLQAVNLSAQCERLWSTELSRKSTAEISSISPAKDGYQIFGTFTDSITVDSTVYVSNGGRDLFLMVADSSGKIQRTVCFGGGGDDIPAMVIASDSSLTMGGLTTCRDGEYTGDVFLRSYDNELNETLGIDIPYTGRMRLDIVNVADDAVMIGGSLKGSVKTEAFTINNHDAEHAFITRFSHDGEYIDSWNSEGTGKHRLHSIDADGERITLLLSAAEGTFVTDTLPVTSFDRQGVCALSLDGSLSPLWAYAAKCNGYAEPSKVAHTRFGILTCINFCGELETPDSTYLSSGNMSSLVSCHGNDGSVLWTNELDGNYCRIVDMACSDSMTVCTGYFRDILLVNGDTICQSPSRKAFLLCFDKDGGLTWNASMDSDGSSTGRSVVVEGGEVVLCSSSRKPCSRSSEGITTASDFAPSNSIGKYKLSSDEEYAEDDSSDDVAFWLDGAIDSLNSSDEDIASVATFPNPTSDKVYWMTDGIMVTALEVYDVKGLLVVRKDLGGQTAGGVDLSRLTNGAYVFRFISESGIQTLEIIKN